MSSEFGPSREIYHSDSAWKSQGRIKVVNVNDAGFDLTRLQDLSERMAGLIIPVMEGGKQIGKIEDFSYDLIHSCLMGSLTASRSLTPAAIFRMDSQGTRGEEVIDG